MSEQKYSVVVTGAVRDGFDPEAVKQSLAALFKTRIELVEKLLGGNPMVIKRNVGFLTAEKYLKAIEKAGACCELREEAGASEQSATGAVAGNEAEETGRPLVGQGHPEQVDPPEAPAKPASTDPVNQSAKKITRSLRELCGEILLLGKTLLVERVFNGLAGVLGRAASSKSNPAHGAGWVLVKKYVVQCPGCGRDYSVSANFCGFCGEKNQQHADILIADLRKVVLWSLLSVGVVFSVFLTYFIVVTVKNQSRQEALGQLVLAQELRAKKEAEELAEKQRQEALLKEMKNKEYLEASFVENSYQVKAGEISRDSNRDAENFKLFIYLNGNEIKRFENGVDSLRMHGPYTLKDSDVFFLQSGEYGSGGFKNVKTEILRVDPSGAVFEAAVERPTSGDQICYYAEAKVSGDGLLIRCEYDSKDRRLLASKWIYTGAGISEVANCREGNLDQCNP